jgi:hypothetical protein
MLEGTLVVVEPYENKPLKSGTQGSSGGNDFGLK